MTQIPEFDLEWGVPVDSKWLRSNDFKAVKLQAAQNAIFKRTGVDFTKAPFPEVVAAIGELEGEADFPTALLWLLGIRQFDVAGQPLEVQQQIPLWFWEGMLEHVRSSSRFDALRYVSAESFEAAIEQWANKPAGVSLGAINFWRKKRTDAWGIVPEHTFFSLYG